MNHILRVTTFTAILLTTGGAAHAFCDSNSQDYTEDRPLVGQASGLNSGGVVNKVDINGLPVAVSPFDPNGHDTWTTITALWGAEKNVAVATKGCIGTNPLDPSDITDLTKKFPHVVHAYEYQAR